MALFMKDCWDAASSFCCIFMISLKLNKTGRSRYNMGNSSWNSTFKSYSSNSWKNLMSRLIDSDWKIMCELPCFCLSFSYRAAVVGKEGLNIRMRRSATLNGWVTSVIFSLYRRKIVVSTMTIEHLNKSPCMYKVMSSVNTGTSSDTKKSNSGTFSDAIATTASLLDFSSRIFNASCSSFNFLIWRFYLRLN